MEQPLNFFGKNLQYLRRKKKMKQHEMQDSLGFSRTTWSNYEKSRTAPPLDGLIKISKFFGVNLDELIAQDIEQMFEERKYKPYAYNETVSMVEEPGAVYYTLKDRVEKLEIEMGIIKSSWVNSPF
jgi:transcriptional regulator with XRE-family HTH domain